MYSIDGREKTIEPGEFLVVTKNTSYECYIDSEECVEDICIQLTDETIQEVCGSIVSTNKELLDIPFGNKNCGLDLKTISFTDGTFLYLLKEIAKLGRDDFERDELKLQLINYYFRNYYLEQLRKLALIENENLSTKLEILKRVNQAKDFLHSNYAQPIDLHEIAMASCISPSHLIKKFNEVFKVTPYQYLRNLRLKKAIELLKSTDLPVEQVAYKLGFESPSSFIRAFRETYNTTPNIIRKQYKTCIKADLPTPIMN